MNAAIDSLPVQADALARARAFAEPLLASAHLDTAENMLDHADAVAAILRGIGGSEAMQAASYLEYVLCVHLLEHAFQCGGCGDGRACSE